jgi:phosphosulfolactate synthase (CoM biosynthesis protein A)
MEVQAMKQDLSRGFEYVHINQREGKPRTSGITEIRGPYYAPMGKRYLADILETMGEYVDILKFSGGSFALMPKKAVRELIDRSGIWGTAGTWGRVVTFKEPTKREPASRPRLVDPHPKAGGR